ncbi:hypothetical protein VCHA54P499_180016 [Vibrio chagasii]|nr:hypothetical protein VCHA54P499_180016 [Vibrio chagasii]CAH7138790.1 hypothetical protein VCHA53O466_210017 [Vibrio chagasii]
MGYNMGYIKIITYVGLIVANAVGPPNTNVSIVTMLAFYRVRCN